MECESGYFSLIYQGIYYNFRESNNLVDSIRNVVNKGRLCDMELFVFTDNWVFESVFYKGKLKSTMFFETVLQLHELTVEGVLIMHVVHISGTRMIEAGIDDLSIRNYMGCIMQVIYPLKFIPIHVGALERSN